MKKFAMFICILFVFTVAAAVAYSALGLDWFSKGEGDKVPDPNGGNTITDVLDGDGNALDGSTTYNMPSSMAFVTPSAMSMSNPNGVTLSATVLPANAKNKLVDWSVAWVSSGAGSADTYVSVTPSSDGSTTATVKCLQPFGHKIKIVVTSRNNPEAKATCTLDYIQRIDSMGGVFESALNETFIEFEDGEHIILPTFTDYSTIATFFQSSYLELTPYYGVGTYSDDNEIIDIAYSDAFISLMSALSGIEVSEFPKFIEGDVEGVPGFLTTIELFSFFNLVEVFDQITDFETAIAAFLYELTDTDVPDITITQRYESPYFDTVESTCYFSLDRSVSTRYNVTQVVLDDSSLIF